MPLSRPLHVPLDLMAFLKVPSNELEIVDEADGIIFLYLSFFKADPASVD